MSIKNYTIIFAHYFKINIKIMPKVKTHSGAKKRFKITGTGKIKHFHSSASHLMRKKSKKAKRNLRQAGILDKSNLKRVRALLGL